MKTPLRILFPTRARVLAAPLPSLWFARRLESSQPKAHKRIDLSRPMGCCQPAIFFDRQSIFYTSRGRITRDSLQLSETLHQTRIVCRRIFVSRQPRAVIETKCNANIGTHATEAAGDVNRLLRLQR